MKRQYSLLQHILSDDRNDELVLVQAMFSQGGFGTQIDLIHPTHLLQTGQTLPGGAAWLVQAHTQLWE